VDRHRDIMTETDEFVNKRESNVIKDLILKELYAQMNMKPQLIPHIKAGMVERWEAVVAAILASEESKRSADRMKAQSEGKNLVEEVESEQKSS